jgi:nucleotide-binding universal stress UspA family protein
MGVDGDCVGAPIATASGMLRSLLVGLDGSRASKKAWDLTLSLAKACGSSIEALSVVDPALGVIGGMIGLEERLQGSVEAAAKRLLEAAAAEAKEAHVAARTTLRVGWPESEIVDRGREADLLVLGRRSVVRDPASDGPGAVAAYVLRRSKKPRLIIDEGAELPKRVLVGFDGSRDARLAVTIASEIAKKTQYPLTVFHANPESQGDRALAPLGDLLRLAGGPDAQLLELEATPATVVGERWRDQPDTLFVFGAGGRSRVSDWLLGTWTETIFYDARATILVCGPAT